MRVLLLAVCSLMLLSGCGSDSKSVKGNASEKCSDPRMKFENETADFGTVQQGEKVVLFYTFENAGGRDLVIYEALPSCGCTSPKYEQTPVKPGEKRTVEIAFDSSGWQGAQQKSVTFKTNGVPDYATVTLTGIVE